MNPFITPNTLDKCKLSFADFVKPVELLDKDATYIIGNFTVQDKTICVALKNGNYYFTTNNTVVKKIVITSQLYSELSCISRNFITENHIEHYISL